MSTILKYTVRRFLGNSRIPQLGSAAKASTKPPAEQHGGTSKIFRSVSLFVAIPAIILMSINCYLSEKNHPHERPEYIPYDYLCLRTKRYPFGDGSRTLFHNKHRNPLPDHTFED